jgi:type VI secretion system protein ImpL
MSSKSMTGYWIVVIAVTTTAALSAWFYGDGIYPSPLVRVLVIGLVGVLLLLMEGLVRGALRWTTRAEIAKKGTRYTRDSGARAGAQITAGTAPVTSWQRLVETLRSEHGRRWRYRRPWLLITGAPKLIEGLSANAVSRGWEITDSAVLLWNRTSADGHVDADWLRQLARLRRGRPLDAVIAMVDGEPPLQDPSFGVSGSAGLQIARTAEILNWAAPVYVVNIDSIIAARVNAPAVIGCEFSPEDDQTSVAQWLNKLRDWLADAGVRRLCREPLDGYEAGLSQYLDSRAAPLADLIARLKGSRPGLAPVRGAFFTSRFHTAASAGGGSFIDANRSLWRYIGDNAVAGGGRRVGLHPVTVCSAAVSALLAIWVVGMLASGVTNAREMALTNESLAALQRAPDVAARLRGLLGLQQRISVYEYRVQHDAPFFSRFGLNHDRQVLNALWAPYARAARTLLVAPAQQDIEGQLADLGQMSTAQLDGQTSQLAQDGHQALKTYLMMVEPQRADPAFMKPQLERHWNLDTGLRPGEKLDLSAQLLGFWAQHLPTHPDWRIAPREELVGNARQTLLAVIGVKSSEDTIYRGILDSVGRKYPDQTLASLTSGTDTRGLFRTTAMVPGVFTRQAWEGSIEAAIDEAAKHNGVAADWVLGNAAGVQAGTSTEALSPDALRTALRKHYFSDYAEHWQDFMNSVRCDATPTLPAAVGQLKLLADTRQSPLIALMRSLAYQGRAGAQQASLSDALVTRAQNLFGKKDEAPQPAQPDPAGPLAVSFGPVLKLVALGNGNAAPSGGDLSLERFTERVTALRLKLQQISDSADSDEEARQVAQALYQGKGSDLSDTLGYAQLIAASLGEQWAGMGNSLFVEPVTQATRTVLAPAQASLNDAWRQSIVVAWTRSFAGRYPFASTSNDASLPELARFLRPQGGLIDTFLSTQLAGALQLQGDQWVPAAGGAGGGGMASTARAFDPAFLKAINTLQQVAGHLLAQGEPQFVFGLKPVPTPGVTDTLLTLDGQTLHYYNQREAWNTMTWPSGEPQKAGTRLEWQTDTVGTNRGFEFSGRWALVRMLERASVEPLDSATYQLTWRAGSEGAQTQPIAAKTDAVADDATLNAQGPLAPAPASITHPLRYLMRTDVGRGPLELLALRGFVLPSRIFVDNAATAPKPIGQAGGPPPLPTAALVAAKQAAVSIPAGRAP